LQFGFALLIQNKANRARLDHPLTAARRTR
jgi:hypothetical protein